MDGFVQVGIRDPALPVGTVGADQHVAMGRCGRSAPSHRQR